MKGFSGGSVHEITADFDSNTWRAIYTLTFKDAIYVLYAFQKKSKRGIKTPQQHIRMIRRRLKLAKEYHEQANQKKQR